MFSKAGEWIKLVLSLGYVLFIIMFYCLFVALIIAFLPIALFNVLRRSTAIRAHRIHPESLNLPPATSVSKEV